MICYSVVCDGRFLTYQLVELYFIYIQRSDGTIFEAKTEQIHWRLIGYLDYLLNVTFLYLLH